MPCVHHPQYTCSDSATRHNEAFLQCLHLIYGTAQGVALAVGTMEYQVLLDVLCHALKAWHSGHQCLWEGCRCSRCPAQFLRHLREVSSSMRLHILQGDFYQCRHHSAALQPPFSSHKGDLPKAFLPVVLH